MIQVDYFRVEKEAFDDLKYGKFLPKNAWNTSVWCATLSYGTFKDGIDFAILKYPGIGNTPVPIKYLKPKDWNNPHKRLKYDRYHLKCLGCYSTPLEAWGNQLYCNDIDHQFICEVHQNPKYPEKNTSFELTVLNVLKVKYDGRTRILSIIHPNSKPEEFECSPNDGDYDDISIKIKQIADKYFKHRAFT